MTRDTMAERERREKKNELEQNSLTQILQTDSARELYRFAQHPAHISQKKKKSKKKTNLYRCNANNYNKKNAFI